MAGPLGNSEFCFPRISMFPETKSRETLRFSGNKIHCSPRDQSLSVYCIFFFHFLIDIQPKMGQINIRKKKIFLRNLEDFLRNLD